MIGDQAAPMTGSHADRVKATALEARRQLKTRYVHRLLGSPIRSADSKSMAQTFLVCAVATVLAIRVLLALTGYAQLGGGGLHVAHLLWGGAFLGIAVLLTLSLITRGSRWIAAVLGGVGFGLFIDEIGKFVTSDNDYFFRPTFALIYVALVLVWLATRALALRPLTQREALANALDVLKEAAIRDLSADERARALELLEQTDPKHPLVPQVHGLLLEVTARPALPPFAIKRLVRRARAWYWRRTKKRWFTVVLTVIFVVLTAYALSQMAELGKGIADAINAPDHKLSSLNAAVNGGDNVGFSGWAMLASSSIVAVLYVIGVYMLVRRTRLEAYRWFEWGLLVSIFVVQVFAFADQELGSVAILILNLALLITVRAMTVEEQLRQRPGEANGSRSSTVATVAPAAPVHELAGSLAAGLVASGPDAPVHGERRRKTERRNRE
jgi:hypothetical protein